MTNFGVQTHIGKQGKPTTADMNFCSEHINFDMFNNYCLFFFAKSAAGLNVHQNRATAAGSEHRPFTFTLKTYKLVKTTQWV